MNEKAWTTEEIRHLLNTSIEMVWRSALYIHFGPRHITKPGDDRPKGEGQWWIGLPGARGAEFAYELSIKGYLHPSYTDFLQIHVLPPHVERITHGINSHEEGEPSFFKLITDRYSEHFDRELLNQIDPILERPT